MEEHVSLLLGQSRVTPVILIRQVQHQWPDKDENGKENYQSVADGEKGIGLLEGQSAEYMRWSIIDEMNDE